MSTREHIFYLLLLIWLLFLAVGLAKYWTVDNPPFGFSYFFGIAFGALGAHKCWMFWYRTKKYVKNYGKDEDD